MNLDDIKFFYFVAEKKSFSSAAAALRTNISSVSRRVKNLEDALGAKLLIRHSRGVELTDEGASILASAKRIYDESLVLSSMVGELANKSQKTIRLAVQKDFLSTWFLPKLPRFFESFPGYTIEIVDEENIDLERARPPDAYIALTKNKNLNLVEKKIGGSRFQLFGSNISITNLPSNFQANFVGSQNIAVISYSPESGFPTLDVLSSLYSSNGLLKNCVLEVTTISEMYAAVKNGVGIGMLPEWIEDESLQPISLSAAIDSFNVEIFLSFPEHLRGSVRLEVLKNFLADYFNPSSSFVESSHARPNPAPLKICSLFSQTGFMSPWESSLNAVAKMCVDNLNDQGGLLGRSIEIYQPDLESNWHKYSEYTKKGLASGYQYFFGCWTSAARKQVIPALTPGKGLLYYPLHFEGNELSDDVIYLNAPPTKSVIPALEYARVHQPDSTRVINIGSDYVWPRTINETVSSYLKASGMDGSKITARYYPLGFTEFEDELHSINKALNRDPLLLCISLVGPSLRSFLSQLASLDLESSQIQIIAFDATDLDTMNMDCSKLGGLITCWGYFQQVAQNEANDLLLDSWYKQPTLASLPVTDPAVSTINAISLWAKAVELAQSDNLDEVRLAMRSVTTICPSSGRPIGLGKSGNIVDRKSIVATLSTDGRFYPIPASTFQ